MMTHRDFVYWLNGFFELSESTSGLSKKQVQQIKDHLSLVLNKKTPKEKINTIDLSDVRWENKNVWANEDENSGYIKVLNTDNRHPLYKNPLHPFYNVPIWINIKDTTMPWFYDRVPEMGYSDCEISEEEGSLVYNWPHASC